MRTVVTVLVASLCAGAVLALDAGDCTFYAPFDGSFDASVSRGSPAATAGGVVPFVEGMLGQGILVGASGAELRFPTEGNLDLEAGTVSLWVKPEGWGDRTDATFRPFFAVAEGDVSTQADGGTFMWLYRYFQWATYFLVWDSRGSESSVRSGQGLYQELFRPGEWLHLVGTWNGDEIACYCNGKLAGRSRGTAPRVLRSLGDTFSIGGANRAGTGDTVVDEFRLFDRALTPPEVDALYHLSLDAAPQQLEVQASYIPEVRKLRVDVNALARKPSEVGGLSARVVVRRARDGKVGGEKTCEFRDSQHVAAEFDTAGLPRGEYEAFCDLTDGGRSLATSTTDVTVKPIPDWSRSRVGVTDKVPEPWTPLTVKRGEVASSVQCWGPRRYLVGDSLLPSRLYTASRSILASPIALTGTVNGAPLRLSPCRTTWQRVSPTRVEFTTSTRSGDVDLTASSFIEYDGLLWTTVRLSSGQPIRISRLVMDIPLRSEAATLMQTALAWDDAGTVRPWRHRLVANTQLWLGNETGGLQCTLPSARNWMNADRTRQVEILPAGDCVTLRLNLVDKEWTFTGDVDYTFGLQLTPVRPAPKGWRSWRIKKTFWPAFTEGWSKGSAYPVPKPEWDRIFRDAATKGHLPALYIQPFGEGIPDAPNVNDPSWASCLATTFRKVLTGSYRDLPWGAVYFDVAQSFMCDDPDFGYGYCDEYGVWQPEQNYLHTREVQKRFYVALQETWPDRPLLNHQSGVPSMMQLAFSHAFIDGENLTDWVGIKGFNYYDILTLDRMRAEYMGHNYGFVPIFLPEFTRAGAGRPEVLAHFAEPEPPELMHLLGLLLVHDVVPWRDYPDSPLYDHLWAFEDAFGWDDDVEFLPYWSNQRLVRLTPADPNVVCSLYRRPGKLMIVVMNNTDEDHEVIIQLDPVSLGMPEIADGRADDAWEAAESSDQAEDADPVDNVIPLAEGRATLSVGRRTFRVLTVGAGAGRGIEEGLELKTRDERGSSDGSPRGIVALRAPQGRFLAPVK